MIWFAGWGFFDQVYQRERVRALFFFSQSYILVGFTLVLMCVQSLRERGTTQMKFEEEMGVKIIFPSSRNEDHISKIL